MFGRYSTLPYKACSKLFGISGDFCFCAWCIRDRGLYYMPYGLEKGSMRLLQRVLQKGYRIMGSY